MQDSIANLVLDCFNKTLPKTGKPHSNEWTVLSAIVKEFETNLELVSLGTGSKCIGKNSLSKNGDVLNDSHAEVIARRGFLSYLYSEIELDSQSEIFNRNNATFTLKNGVIFHFFTTHMPCGDAAIFPKTQQDFGKCLNSNKRRKLDIFRTGAKCLECDVEKDLHLEGDEYHLLGKVRTKPGRGDPTLSVSCSDKLAKWQQIGLQGALLSLLIPQPIKFQTFIIISNTQFSQESLERTFFKRLNNKTPDLIFQQTKSTIAFQYNKTDQKKPSPNSIIYYKLGNNSFHHEVAVGGKKLGLTKTQKNNPKNRLSISKMELFHRFVRIARKFDLFVGVEKSCYRNAKLLAIDYQSEWEKLKQDDFKVWTNKDDSLLDFYLD